MSLFLPAWLRQVSRRSLGDDVTAGVVGGILVIPQSLGYALLAGLPPVYGLYAAILPVLVYAWVGSSNTQAVGPVAVTSIMTAQALSGTPVAGYAPQAALLAALVGGWLWLAGLLRLGWITQFISRGVMSGLVSGAAILIALGQLRHVLGLPLQGDTLLALLHSAASLPVWRVHPATAALGLGTLVALVALRRGALPLFAWMRVPSLWAGRLARLSPLLVMAAMTWLSAALALSAHGVTVVGSIAPGLPALSLPPWPTAEQVHRLLPASALIALVAFVSSVSVAQDVAHRRQEVFEADRELTGLGFANLAAALSQGFPIAGGFSRTAVNLEAGAKTPLAGVVSALTIALVLVFFTGWFAPLPLAVLAAGIVVASLRMVDGALLQQAWASDRSEAITLLVTAVAVLFVGLQTGLLVGLLCSFAALIRRSSRPHVAVVGAMPDDPGHFRNVARHAVVQHPSLLLLRVDESIFFGNSRSIQRQILATLKPRQLVQHVVLIGSGINDIDLTGQLMLVQLNRLLQAQGVRLHLAEIKGPVMDRLRASALLPQLSGEVFWSTQAAVATLLPEPDYVL